MAAPPLCPLAHLKDTLPGVRTQREGSGPPEHKCYLSSVVFLPCIGPTSNKVWFPFLKYVANVYSAFWQARWDPHNELILIQCGISDGFFHYKTASCQMTCWSEIAVSSNREREFSLQRPVLTLNQAGIRVRSIAL